MSAQTPNLEITEVAASQNQKEVVINQGFVELEAALTNFLPITMPDADYVLTTGEYEQALGNLAFQFSGFITADRNIIVPLNKKLYLVMNNTSTSLGFNLTVKTPSGTGVAIAPNNSRYTWCYCDGTNVIAAGQPSGAGAGTVTNNEGSLTANEVVIGSGGADVKVLGSLGATGTVLTSNGPGVPPSWQSGGGGGGGNSPQTRRFQQDYVNHYNSGSSGLDGPADQGTMGTFFGKVNSSSTVGFIEQRTPTGAGVLAGFYDNAGFNYFYMGKNLGLFADVSADRATDCRHWVGFYESSGSPDSTFGGSDSPAQNYIAFRFSTHAGDTHYKCICHDGVTSTIVDSGVVGNTSSHRFAIDCDDFASSVKFYIDGNLVATITTHVPAAGTAFKWFAGAGYVSSSGLNSGTSAISLFSDF